MFVYIKIIPNKINFIQSYKKNCAHYNYAILSLDTINKSNYMRDEINGKADKTAALPKLSDALTLSELGGADYAHPLALSHLKFSVITLLYIIISY